jgi:hypothetical protein
MSSLHNLPSARQVRKELSLLHSNNIRIDDDNHDTELPSSTCSLGLAPKGVVRRTPRESGRLAHEYGIDYRNSTG